MSDQPANPGYSDTLTSSGGEQAPSQAPAETSLAHKIFFGRDGILRPGWRLFLYILMFWALAFVVNHSLKAAGFHMSELGEQNSPRFIIVTRILNFMLMFIPAVVMARIERRPVGDYGIPARGAFGKRFWEGVLWGFVSLSLLLLLLRATGAFYFGNVALAAKTALYYGVIWGVAFLFVAFFEEWMFRGYIQFTLTTAIGFWPTAIILSLLFAAAHYPNPGETWLGLVDVFLAGMVLAAMLLKTGNLWLPIGFHLGWDWAETYFYGVADSGMTAQGALLHPSIPSTRAWWLTGGSVGPEGSIFSCIVEVLLILAIIWRFRQDRYPAPEPKFIAAWKQRLGFA